MKIKKAGVVLGCASVLFMMVMTVGCAPCCAIVRPGAIGVVVDEQTCQPIAGARVTMDSAHDTVLSTWPSFVPARGVTETNGIFMLPPQRKWILFSSLTPIQPPKFVISVEYPGYKTYKPTFLYPYVFRPPTINFGEIELMTVKEMKGRCICAH